MNKTQNFDLLHSKLEGTNLIEASAGTGKTYTITGLFLRLVVERELPVDQILVVTFTEAATEELRDRIRSALRKTKEVFSGKKSDNEFLNEFVEKYKSIEDAPKLLRDAIRDFDQASIFTIHGFCKRMLDENAFESGSLFDTELVTDQENIKKEIVQDFWRKHIYNESPLFVNFALQNKFNPDSLSNLVGYRIIQPDFKVIPQVEIPDSTPQEIQFQRAFEELRSAWHAAKIEVENILLNNENLSRIKYKKENLPLWIDLMDEMLATNGTNPVLFDKFEKFTLKEIQGATKKNCPVPHHPFFELCEKFKQKQDKLQKVFEQRILGLKAKLFNYVQEELIKRKKSKNIQSFDDLLLKLHTALQAPGGSDLADAIRKKFRAALIDEFQDTDPVQYAIFKNIFDSQNSILFLIGDPKQAIYGFRGADIFAYMDASKHTASRFTLSQNWRSEPELITAINAIFSSGKFPFIYEEIPFEPVKAAVKKDRDFLKIDNIQKPPFQLWYLDATKISENDKSISKTEARTRIYQAVAAEISRLLNLSQEKRIKVGARPLKEQDIAVLVRRNAEALQMQQALSDLNIPSVLYSTNNLFDSYEAMEVQRILASIVELNNDDLLRAALATDMLGVTGEEIDRLMEDETEWESWLIKFKNYHDNWNRRGFISMFRSFLSDQGVLPRLMAFPDGERRATNVLHLAEVLHQISVEKKLGTSELLKWLSEQRDPHTPRLEEHQLRLETDENAVKLATVHKSKGLEYPVVFCPFTWDGSRIKGSTDYLAFHDESDKMKLTIDLGSENKEENQILAEKELLAENLRLLYVALTRAKHRCYLVWGRFNEAETSAPAYLFHQSPYASNESLVQETGSRFREMNDKTVHAELEKIAAKSNGTIGISNMEVEAGQKYAPKQERKENLIFQPFRTHIDSDWRISSYSSFVSRISYAAEIADYDYGLLSEQEALEITEETRTEKELTGIISFPKGTKAGIFFHKIFELINFEQGVSPSNIEIIDRKLMEYGFDPKWNNDVVELTQKVLTVTLASDYDKFTLSQIHHQQRLNELEFYFPLKTISSKSLKNIFKKYAGYEFSENFPENIERLDFVPMRGFMKGFIDLVFQFKDRFYIIDWKSNFLGERLEDYELKKLKKIMENEFYILQYYIYTVALHQYLKTRILDYDYNTHFGGVYYIFLRGVAPEMGIDYGVYRDRPSADFINELCEDLITSRHS